MNFEEVMNDLETKGTAQNRKVYGKHGVPEPMFGVSMANLKALKKRIKTNQELAEALWQNGNHDARYLATMIADPKQISGDLLDKWAAGLNNYPIADALSGFVAKTPLAQAKMEAWTQSDDEWIGQAGWNLLAHLAMKDKTLPDAYFEPYLHTIESNIHTQKNRVRYSMNSALIAIGVRNAPLTTTALHIANVIGPVEVDHGDTSCKTPNATDYIHKTLTRRSTKK